MITPSPELVALVTRWQNALRHKDGATLQNLLSTSEHLRYQGSAEGESWSGSVFRKGFPAHASEIPDFDEEVHSIEAFTAGDVGWAHVLSTLSIRSTGVAMLHRFTFVLTLEQGAWRFVQLHVSNPIPNIDKIGIEHVALNDLVEAARDGFHLNQTEGLATVMFTDVANSSTIASVLGDRVWTARIARHFDAIGAAIAAEGGQMVKSLGDGTMSSFASTSAALRAALAILDATAQDRDEPHLGVRIGLHTGEVIAARDDFFGSVVNKSARICAAAAPGEICVSDATHLMVASSGAFTFGAPVEASLKGFDGVHRLFTLHP